MKFLFFTWLYLCSLLVHAQKTTYTTTTAKPFVLGSIEELASKILGEKRILNIYLPEGYQQNDTTRYAVSYLLDGSADEDFIHVAGLYQFHAFSWINRVPPTIVVGIATVDRRRDFTFPTVIKKDQQSFPTSGHSDNFIQFLEKELQPFIERKYRTNASKTLIGQSLGGLLATEILLKKPNLFNQYIIVSPSLWWNNGSLLDQTATIKSADFITKTAVYIGVGKEGLTPTEIPRVMEVDVNVLAEKLKASKIKNLNVYFDYLPEEDHATIMHQAVFNALRRLHSVPPQNHLP